MILRMIECWISWEIVDYKSFVCWRLGMGWEGVAQKSMGWLDACSYFLRNKIGTKIPILQQIKKKD